jgi:tRNA threonylcarbamoyl adenosine modification protein YjeE
MIVASSLANASKIYIVVIITMTYISTSELDTARYAHEYAKQQLDRGATDHATVLALQGDLGSGKTFFVKELAKFFGVTETITSPTFVIAKFYPINSNATVFKQLVHIDAYRLESSRELLQLGFESWIADPANLICLEWPEIVSDIIPDYARTLRFEYVTETERKMSF